MNNLRIVYDNAADRSTLSAASTAGTFGVANLLLDERSAILRSTGRSQTITMTWPTQESVACAALIFTNLTSGAQMRVRGYAFSSDADPVLDTGWVYPCKPAVHGSFPWGTMPLGWNAYQWGGVNTWARGGGSHAITWFEAVRVQRLVIEVINELGLSEYLEFSRLVVGNYWSPAYNADYGAQLQQLDTTENYRAASGTLRSDVGVVSNKLSMNLGKLPPLDRAQFMRIQRQNSKRKPMLFSLFPDHSDPLREQDHMIYGCIANLDPVTMPYFEEFSAPFQIEGI